MAQISPAKDRTDRFFAGDQKSHCAVNNPCSRQPFGAERAKTFMASPRTHDAMLILMQAQKSGVRFPAHIPVKVSAQTGKHDGPLPAPSELLARLFLRSRTV